MATRAQSDEHDATHRRAPPHARPHAHPRLEITLTLALTITLSQARLRSLTNGDGTVSLSEMLAPGRQAVADALGRTSPTTSRAAASASRLATTGSFVPTKPAVPTVAPLMRSHSGLTASGGGAAGAVLWVFVALTISAIVCFFARAIVRAAAAPTASSCSDLTRRPARRLATYQAPDYSSNYSSSFSSPLAMPVRSPLAAADLSGEPAAVTRNPGRSPARASNASASPAIVVWQRGLM